MLCMNVTSTFAEPAPAPSQAMDTHSQGCPGSSINSESSNVGAHDTTHPAGGSCGREMRLRSFECFPGKDHDPSFEHMRAPRRKTRVSWVSCSATMLSGGSHSGPADLSPSLIMTQLPFPPPKGKPEGKSQNAAGVQGLTRLSAEVWLEVWLSVFGAHVIERGLRTSWKAYLAMTRSQF